MRPRDRYPRSPGGKARDREKKKARWRKLSADIIEDHPFCQCPHCTSGRFPALPSNIVHHIKSPIVGDRIDKQLFYARDNLLAYAKECHDRFAQSAERGGHGFLKGGDASGRPLDPSHPWNQSEEERIAASRRYYRDRLKFGSQGAPHSGSTARAGPITHERRKSSL